MIVEKTPTPQNVRVLVICTYKLESIELDKGILYYTQSGSPVWDSGATTARVP